MNKWAKKKWVKALRSGEYRQANGTLVDGTPSSSSYCCLGVLLAEARPESICFNPHYPGLQYLYVKPTEEDDDIYISIIADDLATLYGLDKSTQKKLADFNDSGKSFDDIADWIDANL